MLVLTGNSEGPTARLGLRMCCKRITWTQNWHPNWRQQSVCCDRRRCADRRL